MSWSKKKANRVLKILLPLQLVFAIAAIILICFKLVKGNPSDQLHGSFIYLLATTFGTGLGCLWFRLRRAHEVKLHGMIHILVLVAMLVGHREIFTLLEQSKYSECYNKYSINMITLCLYGFQLLMTLYFFVTRKRRTADQRAFRYGLHAFFGVLTFFVSSLDGVLVCHRMARDEELEKDLSIHLACVCILFYCIIAWYVLLNPYLDWRRTSRLWASLIFVKRSRKSTKLSERKITIEIPK